MTVNNTDPGDLKDRIAELEYEITLLKKDLIHDTLTGLKTRRFFEQESRNHTSLTASKGSKERRQRTNLNTSFIFFDIDHFKKINDTYGHATGDEVLKLVAQKIQQGIRKKDIASRWGGEEFVVMLSGADTQGALTRAESIRKSMEDVSLSNQPEIKVSVSGGVAEHQSNETPEETIRRADQALYAAKNAGRNQVVTYSELPN